MYRLLSGWLVILAIAFSPLTAAAATPDDEAAKAAVAVQVALLKIKNAVPVPPKSTQKITTTCGCGATGLCDCWNTQCACATCGRGAALKAPKASSPAAGTGLDTTAQTAGSKGSTLGSSGAINNQGGITTLVPATERNGGIMTLPGASGCPNGNCPSSMSRSRNGFFRR